MANRPHLLFYFLHLLGVGHVFRAQRLVKAFLNAGFDVDIIYGGKPVPGFDPGDARVHYLPPISAADASYSQWLDGNGDALGDDWMEKRCAVLLDAIASLQPDAVLTEAFPFGRRVVRHEVTAMLDALAAKSRPPLVTSSVRDILQPRTKPGRDQETVDVLHARYDQVLVHSDPALVTLEETFPLTCEIEPMLGYTGFVVPANLLEIEPSGAAVDIVATAGGGAFGGEMLDVVVQLAALRPELNFLIATGSEAKEGAIAKLIELAGPNVRIVKRINGLAGQMAAARLSISQCGYNTAMDVLASRSRAVFVPHDTTGQKEQALRAAVLERAGVAVSLPQSRLTLKALSDAVIQALVLPKPALDVDFDGAANSAKLVKLWLAARA
ncbi:glycosyltransferase family protein [Ahrensia sp. R2A130]|uniref:glycosyltransferase family protein n=1 Tax=Ahrensia sp. R2A130 TaxID=744979 RepID=UPI0001E0F116|nr:glycosyltransferase [Ahrensia sp. R2A130]EFL88059.1 glycosyltransferase family 28 protein [Ahrensia sp. R2A130]